MCVLRNLLPILLIIIASIGAEVLGASAVTESSSSAPEQLGSDLSTTTDSSTFTSTMAPFSTSESESTSEMNTTPAILITTVTDTPLDFSTQPAIKKKKSKRRRKSKKSGGNSSTTEATAGDDGDEEEDEDEIMSSSQVFSDEDTKLSTAELWRTTTTTSVPLTSSTTQSEIPTDASTTTEEAITITVVTTITAEPTTITAAPTTTIVTEAAPEETSTITPQTTSSTSTIGVISTEKGESTTSTTESSLSDPQAFDSSLMESTTMKGDEDSSTKESTPATPKTPVISGRTLSKAENAGQEEDQNVGTITESSDDSTSLQCVPTVPRLNLHLDMMLGEWYPARISETTSKLWSQSLEKKQNNSVADCFLMDYSMSEGEDDPDTLQITLSRKEESTKLEAVFVGDDHHPKESKWAITWPNGEDTLTSVVAAGVIRGGGGKGKSGGDGDDRGNSSSSRYAWLLTVDCDLNGIVEPDWAVMARVREGISNATLSTILAIVEGLKGLRVDDAITFQSDDCHKNNNNNTNKK